MMSAFGRSTMPSDVDGGMIGEAQYDGWQASFGQTLGTGLGETTLAAIPEPVALILVIPPAAGWWLPQSQAA
jgi:hypothetical protein